jgi:hypothetical protein
MSAGLPAASGWGIRQSNRVLTNWIGGNKTKRRPGTGKKWFAATEHDWAEIESILIN